MAHSERQAHAAACQEVRLLRRTGRHRPLASRRPPSSRGARGDRPAGDSSTPSMKSPSAGMVGGSSPSLRPTNAPVGGSIVSNLLPAQQRGDRRRLSQRPASVRGGPVEGASCTRWESHRSRGLLRMVSCQSVCAPARRIDAEKARIFRARCCTTSASRTRSI